jgi:hypothetical protein
MNIFVLNQIITREGDALLTWQQIKAIRNHGSRGRKPNWFKYIEEKVLANSFSRKIRESYQVNSPNRNMIMCNKQKVSSDKWKKE